MTAPAQALPPLSQRARRATSDRQPHDAWTIVLVPPGTHATPRTLSISVRRVRALFVAATTVGGVSTAAVALLALLMASAPPIPERHQGFGIALGVFPGEVPVVAAAPAPASPLSPFAAAPTLGTAPAHVAAAPTIAAAPAAPSTPARVVRTKRGGIQMLPVVGRITSRFSNARRHPVLGIVRRHKGVDIAAPSGTRIIAPADGRVVFAGRKMGFGNVVELSHGNGVVTRYAHCRTMAVRRGQLVRAGDVIAAVGSTGLASGPHVHYEVIKRGQQVDPLRTALGTLINPVSTSTAAGDVVPD